MEVLDIMYCALSIARGEACHVAQSLCQLAVWHCYLTNTSHWVPWGGEGPSLCFPANGKEMGEFGKKTPPGFILCSFSSNPFLCVPGYRVGKRIGTKQEGSKLEGKGRRRVGGFVFAFMHWASRFRLQVSNRKTAIVEWPNSPPHQNTLQSIEPVHLSLRDNAALCLPFSPAGSEQPDSFLNKTL